MLKIHHVPHREALFSLQKYISEIGILFTEQKFAPLIDFNETKIYVVTKCGGCVNCVGITLNKILSE